VSDELLALAIHEAGHAVAHLTISERRAALGLPAQSLLRSVSVDPAARTGLCRVRVNKQRDRRDYAAMCLAGYAAECRHLHGPAWRPAPDAFAEHMHLQDIAMAAAEVAGFADPAAELWRAWAAAVAIVTAEWVPIERLGYRLRRGCSMAGAEFEAAWRSARNFVS
jgi:hypothetical protein